MTTRRQNVTTVIQNQKKSMKRQAESPEKIMSKRTKRTAFGDITNAVKQTQATKDALKQMTKKTQKIAGKKVKVVAVPRPSKKSKTALPSSQPDKGSQPDKAELSWDIIELSQGSQSSQDSHISSQDSNHSSQSSLPSSLSNSAQTSPNVDPKVAALNERNSALTQEAEKDADWEDIDAEYMNDPFQVALYAHDIFLYYKEREVTMKLEDYMTRQQDLTSNMRAILVDWLVEVQENFELNHETLYLAVKMVDHYLVKNRLSRERLQLLGATCLFIACKFDERCPPVLDDFLYICDDAYDRPQMIRMEMEVLRQVGFDLGYPLSYRFLRRFARCAKANMETLTLSRYILEMSQMEYKLALEFDSLVAASALYLAMKMKQGVAVWSPTMVHYTGYNEKDILPVVLQLNKMITAQPNKNLSTIRSKYSHRVFHEVALIAPLTESQLDEISKCIESS